MKHLINYVEGDIFNSTCKAIVCPSNCFGVMGKGLAWEFKNRYPHFYWQYKNDCEDGEVRVGEVRIYTVFPEQYELKKNPEYIINFPTKLHWKNPSTYDYIKGGLQHLVSVNENIWRFDSIAFPKLGCGLGNLEWPFVKQIFEYYIPQMEGVVERVEIYV